MQQIVTEKKITVEDRDAFSDLVDSLNVISYALNCITNCDNSLMFLDIAETYMGKAQKQIGLLAKKLA